MSTQKLGRIAQSVTCLATDVCLTADSEHGVGSRPIRQPVAQSVTCLATDVGMTADPGSRVRSRPDPILTWRLIMK